MYVDSCSLFNRHTLLCSGLFLPRSGSVITPGRLQGSYMVLRIEVEPAGCKESTEPVILSSSLCEVGGHLVVLRIYYLSGSMNACFWGFFFGMYLR